MPRFRKKPVEIEARQFTAESVEEILDWVPDSSWYMRHFMGEPQTGIIEIHTLEGKMEASEGDWIIQGVQGEFYSCKPDIFDATYEPVE
jgi:hypothetical protein